MNIFVIILLVALGICIYLFIGFMLEDFIHEYDGFLICFWPLVITVAILGLFIFLPKILYKEALASYANYKFRKRIKRIIKKVIKK
jgi:hypothetical protein